MSIIRQQVDRVRELQDYAYGNEFKKQVTTLTSSLTIPDGYNYEVENVLNLNNNNLVLQGTSQLNYKG